jgi:hypothetical protein
MVTPGTGTTNGYYVVTKTGYYRGMSRVRVRVRLGVCTPPARYLTFLGVISKKMAMTFAEGVIISIKMGLEKCGLKQSS